jgi:hypothetical protein
MDIVWIKITGLDDFFNFYYADFTCTGSIWIEVASCLSENNVTHGVCLPSFND